jgi:hypothetical protein
MGQNVRCGKCGTEVYTTGTRFPPHETPDGSRCNAAHPAEEPEEYTVGFDNDPWVYQGGAWEMGKDS